MLQSFGCTMSTFFALAAHITLHSWMSGHHISIVRFRQCSGDYCLNPRLFFVQFFYISESHGFSLGSCELKYLGLCGLMLQTTEARARCISSPTQLGSTSQLLSDSENVLQGLVAQVLCFEYHPTSRSQTTQYLRRIPQANTLVARTQQ